MVDARKRMYPAVLAIAAMAATLVACTPAAPSGLPGAVAPTADADTSGWSVEAWALESGDPESITTTDASDEGEFHLDLGDEDGLVYVEARHGTGEDAATLSAVVSDIGHAERITLNERTTVAAGYALAQFIDDDLPSGTGLSLGNAALMAANLADTTDGGFGEVLTSYPNGDETSTTDAFTSLTNILSVCVTDETVCGQLYDIAEKLGDSRPASAAAAFAAIARDPAPSAEPLYALSLMASDASPGLTEAPVAWTLALRFDGDGQSLAGPGNFALDAEGDIWVNNNYEYNADPKTPVCGSEEIFQFGPDGEMKGTYTGGGLSGAGFGIDFDPQGRLWISNFGFAALEPGCPADKQPPHNTMSLFTDEGEAISPPEGYDEGDIFWPQGIDSTADGSIWAANCGNSSVTVYPQGDPEKAKNLGAMGMQEPFDVVDNGQAIFVTGNLSDNVAVIDYDGNVIGDGPRTGAFDAPMGIAADEDGNVWVANSGGVSLPCPDRTVHGSGNPSVTMISPDGSTVSTPYTGAGLTLPWGITTDGDGNVWVANFSEKRISTFCGADSSTCPRGLQTGDAISPDETGYPFESLVRLTGIMVDTAGNVWVANNWADVPLQTNPAGHQIVAFVGAAPPVDPPVFD